MTGHHAGLACKKQTKIHTEREERMNEKKKSCQPFDQCPGSIRDNNNANHADAFSAQKRTVMLF